MTYLAYEPALLQIFRTHLRDAVDELRELRCDDPHAQRAMRTVRATLDELVGHWLPVVERVLAAAPLDRTPEHDLDSLDSTLARAMAVERGWSVALDPTVDDHLDAAAVITLADRLQQSDLDDVTTDPALLAWLTTRWRLMARDPAMRATFLEHFPRWTELADALGRHQALLESGDEAVPGLTLAAVDDAVRALAMVLRNEGPPAWLHDVHAYTAALLVRTLDLTPGTLAMVTDELMLRPRDGLDDLPGVSRADVLLHTLLRDPVACTDYLQLALAHPATLFDHTVDPSLPGRVVLKATDPRFVDEVTAGHLVPAVIDWFDQQPSRDPGVLLADLVAPWTVQLSPTHHGWQLDNDRRTALLECALRGDGALQRFIDQQALVIASARRTLSPSEVHRGELLSGWVGLIGGLVMNERVREVTLRRKSWDMLCNIAALVVSLVPAMTASAAVAAGVAIKVVNDHLGPDVEQDRKSAVWGKSAAVTLAAMYLAKQVHSLWVAQDRLPEDFPGPPEMDPHQTVPSEEWYKDFVDWMATLPGGIDGDMANEARHTVWTALNPWLVGELSSQA